MLNRIFYSSTFCGAVVWNTVPRNLRKSDFLGFFKQKRKAHFSSLGSHTAFIKTSYFLPCFIFLFTIHTLILILKDFIYHATSFFTIHTLILILKDFIYHATSLYLYKVTLHVSYSDCILSFYFIRTIFIRTLRLRFAPKFRKMYGLK